MKYRYSRYIGLLIFICDLAIFNLSYILAYYISLNSFYNFQEKNNLWLFVGINLLFTFLTLISRLYNISRTSKVSDTVRTVIRFLILHLFSVTALLFFIPSIDANRYALAITYGISGSMLVFYRALFLYTIRIYRKYGFNYRNVVIVGYGEVALELRKFFRLHPEFGYNFIGFFDQNETSEKIGSIKKLKKLTYNNRIDEIYCVIPYVDYSLVEDLIKFSEKNLIKIKLLTDFRGFRHKGIEIENYDNIPVLNITSLPLDGHKNRVIKRSFDIIFSLLIILLIFSWLFPLIALMIKLDSKGPVFFKQVRSGKGNNNFWCLKFRTMHLNGESDIEQAKIKDSRVTKFGKFLRKTSLDELPQFINVLIGNMSVVGPRPHMTYHTRTYSNKVERFMARHFVKPGITGLAQAKGYRGETKTLQLMKNRVKFDRFYIENWSLLLDLKIILLTIVILIRGDENAY